LNRIVETGSEWRFSVGKPHILSLRLKGGLENADFLSINPKGYTR